MPLDGTQLLQEHAEGASYRQLSKRHGIGHETARQAVMQALDDLEMKVIVDLYGAWRDEQEGKRAEHPAFVVPYQAQPDRTAALYIFGAVCERLKRRKVPFHVRTANVPAAVECVGGQVFQLTLEPPEENTPS